MRERAVKGSDKLPPTYCTYVHVPNVRLVSIQNASCKSAAISDDTHTDTHKSAADLYIYTPHAMDSMKWQDWARLRAEEAMVWQR